MGLFTRLVDRGTGHVWPLKSRHRRKGDSAPRERQDYAFRAAPCWRPDFMQDFIGPYASTLPADLAYTLVKTAGSPTIAQLANVADGVVRGLLTSTNEAQSARMDWADQLMIPSNRRWIYQARIRLHSTIAANQRAAWGVQTAWNDTLGSVAEYVRFKVDGSMVLNIEGYDGTNTYAATSTGITLVADDWHLFEIYGYEDGFQAFFMDHRNITPLSARGNRAIDTLSAFVSTILFQPFVAVQKDSGTGTPSIDLDLIRVDWDGSYGA